MKNNYYWSDDWSDDFYVELAKAGFISTTYDTADALVLLPELQYNYAVLDFKDIHISTKVKKLMSKNDYEFSTNGRFDEVIEKLSMQHKYNWLKGEYLKVLKNLYMSNDKRDDLKVISVELLCKDSNEPAAGEIGYVIGKTYTSLSGFSSKAKEHNNCGTLQLVLLSKYLENNGFEFWNMGHPHMEYKRRLGCKVYSRDEFLKRWNKAIRL